MSRTVRLFRISHYMKSWRLLTGAIYEKRRELLISMQFLIIITFILSLILFYCEHDRQPEAYNNGFASVIWAFAQYIGDPGGFAETPPISIPGKVIACIVGLLGIAIVTVPAGILGAGFTEAIEKENHKEALAQNRARLLKAFERKLDRPTAMQIVPFFRTLADIQSRFHLTCDEMIEAVESTPGFRLINLAATVPTDRMPHDRLAIEHYHQNRSYGQMIDRGAAVTIVSPSSCIDPTVGIFSYYIALIGGFNYISREVGEYAPYRSFYTVRQPLEEGQADYNADLEALMDRPGAWSFTILAASGANEPEYPTQLHFGIGGDKGDESFDITAPIVADRQKYIEFFNGFSARLKEKFDLGADTGRYHSTSSSLLWPRQLHLPADSSNVIVRIAWSTMLWDARRIRIAAFIADEINSTILGREVPASPDLLSKTFGFTGYPT